jgi:YVTN family beta-propeller protein
MKLRILGCVALFCTLGLAADLPNPALIVLVKDANELAIVDPASLKVIARVTTGEAPHEVVLSPDGKTAFVANYGARTPGNSISVIDLATRREIKRVDLGALHRPHGLAQVGGRIYFTAEANKLIGRYDAKSGAVDWLMGIGQDITHMLVVTQDERRIFTANIGSDSITALHLASDGNWIATVIPVGKGPEGIALSPDQRELWTAHSREGGISIIDVRQEKLVQTISVPTKRSNRLQFTPDGKQVLVSDAYGGEVIVLDTASRKEIKRIRTGGQPEGLLITPDGARAFVGLGNGNAVAVVDLASLVMIGKVETGPETDGLGWSQR